MSGQLAGTLGMQRRLSGFHFPGVPHVAAYPPIVSFRAA
jgi:hypothetical protein